MLQSILLKKHLKQYVKQI